VKSIKDFPEMLEKRPIVVNQDMIVLGGNMRLKAVTEAGLKTVPVIVADDWTEEQQRQFIIKDNLGYGEWDWDMIANEWDVEELDTWGLDIPVKSDWNNLDYIDDEVAPPSKQLTITVVVPDEWKDTMAEIEEKVKSVLAEYSGCEVK
jgi:hypothetical protein